jgi:DNA-binding MarR family transcriptional regulator
MAKSSLSAHLTHLESLGLVASGSISGDKRRKRLLLTDKGHEVKRAASPLVAERIEAMLGLLTETEREQAVSGLCLLAEAAHRLGEVSSQRHVSAIQTKRASP